MVITGVISGCGSKDDGKEPPFKSLFTKWTGTQSGNEYDLTGMQYDVKVDLILTYASNAGCICDFWVTGNESEGTFYLSNCTPFGVQPTCQTYTTSYDYDRIDNSSINVCDNAQQTCEVYK